MVAEDIRERVAPRERSGLSKYKNPDFAGILDPSGNPMCTGVVSGLQAVRI
jgi:hypothetical protein